MRRSWSAKEDADRPLRAVEHGEMQPAAVLAEPAVKGGIGDIFEQAFGAGADLDRPAVIVAGRRRGRARPASGSSNAPSRSISAPWPAARARATRVDPVVAPVADAAPVVFGGDRPPIVDRLLGSRPGDDVALRDGGKGRQEEQSEAAGEREGGTRRRSSSRGRGRRHPKAGVAQARRGEIGACLAPRSAHHPEIWG